AVLLGLACGLAWLLFRDPLSALPKPEPNPMVLARRDVFGETRLRSFVELGTAELGTIGIVIDRPIPFRGRKLPVLVVLGGLGTGERNLAAVGEVGENALV